MKKTIVLGGGLGLLILAIVFAASLQPGARPEEKNVPQTVADPLTLPGISTTTSPWPVELVHLKERLAADALPALATEGNVLHIHQHLDLFVAGKALTIPSGIGVNESARFISPLHTHNTTGIIHVESPYTAVFTLGEFFDIWGVRFTATCLGGHCVDDRHSLQVYSNGELYKGDPRLIPLTAHQQITVVYGTPEEAPVDIPSSYTFPPGE